ncbi:hypothetical protein ACX0HA_05370 [Flavobacterium hauense]
MISNTDNPDKKKEQQEKPDVAKKQKQIDDNEKFSPGEPDDYDAEEYSTD